MQKVLGFGVAQCNQRRDSRDMTMVRKLFLVQSFLAFLILATPLSSVAHPANEIWCNSGPCRDAAKIVRLAEQRIDRHVSYQTGYNVSIALYPDFSEIRHVMGGLLYRYGDSTREIGIIPIRWKYGSEAPPFSGLAGSYTTLYKVDRGDVDIFFYDSTSYHDGDRKLEGVPYYEALVTHESMPADKAMAFAFTGFSEDEVRSLLASIRLVPAGNKKSGVGTGAVLSQHKNLAATHLTVLDYVTEDEHE